MPATAIADIAKQYEQIPAHLHGRMASQCAAARVLRELIHDPAFICRTDDIASSRQFAFAENRGRVRIGAERAGAGHPAMYRETDVMFARNAPS